MGPLNEAGEAIVDLNKHKCSACEQPLSSRDEPRVAVVKDPYGSEIDYYHLSHAPESVQYIYRLNEKAQAAPWN